MQNKPNFKNAQMNVTIYYTKVYNNETAFSRQKNKPNSNPILSGLRCLRRSYRTDQSQFSIILVSLNGFCIISFSVVVT